MENKDLIKTDFALKFANKVSPGVLLEMVPVKTDKFAVKNECFENVQNQVSKCGGKIVYGWAIHQNIVNGLLTFLEAEAHAIWMNNKKERICVSPQDSKEIIFLEDHNNFVENNNPIPNFRLPLIKTVEFSNLMRILEIGDFTKIAIRKYINGKSVSGKLKTKDFPQFFFEGERLVMDYKNQKFIVNDEELIKLCLISLKIEQIKKSPDSFNLMREVYHLSQEMNYSFKYFVQI